jgi:DNA mismatch endonuclease, patch repair protein
MKSEAGPYRGRHCLALRKGYMDRITPERRSWNMSRIQGRNTAPERRVRSLLHRCGFRFSLRRKDLPGKPDVVLPRFQTAVFVHGCFWHRHAGRRNAVLPKTRSDFWFRKLSGSVERDRQNVRDLKKLGWRVLIVWECELKEVAAVTRRVKRFLGNTRSRGSGAHVKSTQR